MGFCLTCLANESLWAMNTMIGAWAVYTVHPQFRGIRGLARQSVLNGAAELAHVKLCLSSVIMGLWGLKTAGQVSFAVFDCHWGARSEVFLSLPECSSRDRILSP